MAEPVKQIVPKGFRNLDAKKPMANRFYFPLVDFRLDLVDKNKRAVTVSGVVEDRSDFFRAVSATVEQNGGIAIPNKEGTYIEKIIFPELNYVVEFPQFYRKGGLPFRISKDGKKVRWLSMKESKVRGNEHATISDDRQYKQDMPDSDVLSKFSKTQNTKPVTDDPELKTVPVCGGCGGGNDEEILRSPALDLALADPEREFSYNTKTGEITDISFLQRKDFGIQGEFVSKPDEPRRFGMKIPSPSLIAAANPAPEQEQDIGFQKDIYTGSRMDLPEVVRNEMLRCEDRVNANFMGYSQEFISSLGLPKGVYQDRPLAAVARNFDGLGQKESMIIKLLMNPVLRKLWGRLYGLPDEDDCRQIRKEEILSSKAPAMVLARPAEKPKAGNCWISQVRPEVKKEKEPKFTSIRFKPAEERPQQKMRKEPKYMRQEIFQAPKKRIDLPLPAHKLKRFRKRTDKAKKERKEEVEPRQEKAKTRPAKRELNPVLYHPKKTGKTKKRKIPEPGCFKRQAATRPKSYGLLKAGPKAKEKMNKQAAAKPARRKPKRRKLSAHLPKERPRENARKKQISEIDEARKNRMDGRRKRRKHILKPAPDLLVKRRNGARNSSRKRAGLLSSGSLL